MLPSKPLLPNFSTVCSTCTCMGILGVNKNKTNSLNIISDIDRESTLFALITSNYRYVPCKKWILYREMPYPWPRIKQAQYCLLWKWLSGILNWGLSHLHKDLPRIEMGVFYMQSRHSATDLGLHHGKALKMLSKFNNKEDKRCASF